VRILKHVICGYIVRQCPRVGPVGPTTTGRRKRRSSWYTLINRAQPINSNNKSTLLIVKILIFILLICYRLYELNMTSNHIIVQMKCACSLCIYDCCTCTCMD